MPKTIRFEPYFNWTMFRDGGVLEITDIENKKTKNAGAIEWIKYDPATVTISESLVEFLLEYSMEGLKQRIDKDERFIQDNERALK